MKKILLLILIFLTFIACKPAKEDGDDETDNNGTIVLSLNPEIFITRLPDELSEGSGLIFYDNLFWSFNDSGGDNIIYAFNRQGEIQKVLEIVNAENVDWEEIAQDDEFIYIGDFGNNSGTRKDLTIYVISKNEIGTSKNQSINGEKITFSYNDQNQFSFKPYNNAFDCEALVSTDDKLILFTKNWINQTTTVYALPKNVGVYKLEPVDSFNVNGLITGADISPDDTKLALVGYRNFSPIIRLFTNFSNDRFFKGEKILIEMDSIVGAQTEGICFLGNDTLLISCERTTQFEQQVFYIDLKEIF